MRFDVDTFNEIIDTITKNKSRSFLTAFGVFWGIFMLVILYGGSNGVGGMVHLMMNGFATNSGFTFTDETSLPYKGFNKGRYWDLEIKDLDIIRRNVKEIDYLTGEISMWGKTAIYGENKYNDCIVKGVEPSFKFIEEQPLKYGRFLNEIDILENRKVCVVGKKAYEQLFPKEFNPCGSYIKIDGIRYQVVGVSVSESSISVNGRTSESVMIPLSTVSKTYNMGSRIHLLAYTAKTDYQMSEVQEKISKVLKSVHYIHPDDKQAVGNVNAAEMFAVLDNLFIGLAVLTWIIGLGTLLAGVIGVSNIMMVTVKERTSEIGIRRAIGAKASDILQQIISECLVLTIVAGLLGLSAGVMVLNVADKLLKNDAGQHYGFGISLTAGISITVILGCLGVMAALAPALRAMAIKPIEAMREE